MNDDRSNPSLERSGPSLPSDHVDPGAAIFGASEHWDRDQAERAAEVLSELLPFLRGLAGRRRHDAGS